MLYIENMLGLVEKVRQEIVYIVFLGVCLQFYRWIFLVVVNCVAVDMGLFIVVRFSHR
jgi:hypothetical protein